MLNGTRFQNTNKWTMVAYLGLSIALIGAAISIVAWLLG